MKTYLIAFFCLLSAYASAQAVYNPSYTPLFTVASKPYAISQAAPVDGRTYKADSINFLWRPYNGTNEVLSYLNLAKYRTGQFPIEVNIGGTLNNNGTFTGGYIYECWFRNGTADSNLVLKSYWPTSTSGFLQAANNLSDVVSASTSRTNLGLGSMATQSTTAGGDLSGTWPTVTVAQFNGELPSYYLNYNNLNNKPTIPAQFNPIQGTNMSITGVYPNMTFSAVVDVSPTLAQVVYAGNTTDTTIFDYDSLYGEQVAAHGTLYVGDSATYAPRPTQDTILGFGNSIMEGTAATDGLSFFFQYCNYVNAFGLDSGLSGTFLSDFNVNNVPAWTAHHKVMLLYETNDYYGGSITLPNYLTEYVGKIDSLETQKGFPDTSIITLFCPLSDTTEGGLTPFGMETWVNSLDSMAQVMGIPHVDLWHYMYDNGAFTLNYPTSLLHPSQSGHNVIAQAILLQLTKGSGDVKRPLFVRSIKSGQQIVLDAPTILSTGDKIRESNNLPRSASSDLLTSSVSGTDVRSEIRGGMTPSDNTVMLMATGNQGLNEVAGIGAYTLTDSTGIPQAGGYGFHIYTLTSGATLFGTFGGFKESQPGGLIQVSPNLTGGLVVYADGGVSLGAHPADVAGTIYSNSTILQQGQITLEGPLYMASPNFVPSTNKDKPLAWNATTDIVDTANTYNTNPAAFLQGDANSNMSSVVITPAAIGAAPALPAYTIFTPTNAGSVTLLAANYNIINPAGSLTTLTVVLPSSPVDGAFVKIKYTQAIATVTYSGGTVVDGIASPIAGSLVELHYSAGTTSWY